MLPKKIIPLSLFLCLLTSLTACSGSPGLADRFAANPALKPNSDQNTPTQPPAVSGNPSDAIPIQIPRYSNATLLPSEQQITPEQGTTRWTSPDNVNAVESFYQEQFQSNGWQILQPFTPGEPENAIIARQEGLQVRVTLLPSPSATEFTIDYQQESVAVESPTTNSTSPTPVEFSDSNSIAEPLRQPIADLASLGILTPSPPASDRFNPSATLTRREYAKWLVSANNTLHENALGKQIRLGTKDAKPAFRDVPTNDPDFAVIQGLAEAGLIPSALTGDTSAALFRPDALLTREALIEWKVPLDTRKGLPTATLDSIKETWGFQDNAKIDPKSFRALYADFQNGDQANIRRVFGYTTLFQPKKPVTRAEAATALWYFGYQGDGISAHDVLQGQNSQNLSQN